MNKRNSVGHFLMLPTLRHVQWSNLELFSCRAHFLHFVARRMLDVLTEFPRLLLANKGERLKKHAVHRVVHHRVHLGPVEQLPEGEKVDRETLRILGARKKPTWAAERNALVLSLAILMATLFQREAPCT